MSVQNKKFRGFADLYAVEKRKQQEAAKNEPEKEQPTPVQKDKVKVPRADKAPLPTTGGESPPVSTSGDQSPPLTTTPQLQIRDAVESVAPNRDFNKRANSLERDALPSGLFPGTTKKLYDALYLRTRGAVKPSTTVQASRRDLLQWTGIRNLKTIDSHIRYLMASGLIIRHWELGSNEGSFYEVKVPEEIGRYQYPPLPTSGGESDLPPVTTSTHYQKTGSGYTQKMGSGGEGYLVENTDSSYFPKTFFKTNTDDDDYTHTLAEFTKTLARAVRDVCGEDYSITEQEQERWQEMASVLVDELKKTVSRTEHVSSVPAFFSAHLRRCFARKTATQSDDGAKGKSSKKTEAGTNRAQEAGASRVESVDDEREAKSSAGSKFTLEECLVYAEHLHATGQGINNPGGFAIAILRSGMADPLVEKFLHKGQKASVPDAKECPDCRGTGFYYPKGAENGVVKCKHERLAAENTNAGETRDERRLTADEVGEQADIIAELVEGGYTIERAEAQFAASLHPDDWQKIIARIEQKGAG